MDLNTALTSIGEVQDVQLESVQRPLRSSMEQIQFKRLISVPVPMMAGQMIEEETTEEGIIINNDSNLSIRTFFISDEYWENAKEAHCSPHKETVDLGFDDNNSEIKHFPSCVRVKRCGGCCPKKGSIQCTPIKKKRVTIKVIHDRDLHH